MDGLDQADADPHGGHRYEAEVMMQFPFVALREGRTEPIRFPDASGQIKHEVETDRAQGMAVVPDLNVLIWVISELRERIHDRCEDRRHIILTIAHSKLLRYIGRRSGGRQLDLLHGTLERLQATRVKTNLPSKVTKGKVVEFKLLERCACEDPDADDPVWTIVPPDWLIDNVERRLILRINPASMKLNGIERCVYRYARATAVTIDPVQLDPAHAVDRFGSTGKAAVRQMRHKLKVLVAGLERSKVPGTQIDEQSRRVVIPGYIVTASPTDGIWIEPDREALPFDISWPR